MRQPTTHTSLISALLAVLSIASCTGREASPADRASEVSTEYRQWMQVRNKNSNQNGIASEAWVARLERAANDASGTDAGLTCRTQLVALLNQLGRHKDSEEQILRRIEETTEPMRVPFWIAELAEARLRRLGDPKESLGNTVDLKQSVAYFDWAREELEAGLATAESLKKWQRSNGRRQLWVLLNYAELVRLGALEIDEALPPLRRGYELSVAWLASVDEQNGLRPWDFALAEFKLELLREPLDPQRLETSFDRLAESGGDSDRLTQHRLQLLIAVHGEGTLFLARALESWVAQHGVHGPNAHSAALYAARAFLGLEMHADVLRQVEPRLTDEPKWASDRFHSAWLQMQTQNALAYIAAADALKDDRALQLGVKNLLGHEGTVSDTSSAVGRARRFAAQQRIH